MLYKSEDLKTGGLKGSKDPRALLKDERSSSFLKTLKDQKILEFLKTSKDSKDP